MVFSSVVFLCIFLPAVLLGYYVLPKKARNIWLLVASLGFYAWAGPKHLIYLLLSILFNYFAAMVVVKLADKNSPCDERGMYLSHPRAQKIVLALAVIINIASLLYFKYTGMLIETYNGILGKSVEVPEIILPIGISFYTFQCMSYIIDAYRTGQFTNDPVKFALYISMFPQLLQGPIIRFGEVRKALDAPVITADGFSRGLERFIVGLAKKVIIADTLGEVADRIFAIDTAYLSTSIAWLGAILYTLQIFFDFAGYTDMAIGLGKLFGFSFRENFDHPYISRSVTEFWRRWHISLSNWFRDYLYIPLGGNRRGNVYVNLLIVFLATGIWHGAAWGFVVWGLWHGLFMLIERFLRNKRMIAIPTILSSFLKWAYTMLAVTLGWVLFKIEDIQEALSYISVMFGVKKHDYNAFSLGFFLDRRIGFYLFIAILACIPWAQVMPRHIGSRIAAFTDSSKGTWCIARYACLLVLLIVSFVFTVNSTYSPFIYFQF